jgi:hypothetical protein
MNNNTFHLLLVFCNKYIPSIGVSTVRVSTVAVKMTADRPSR